MALPLAAAAIAVLNCVCEYVKEVATVSAEISTGGAGKVSSSTAQEYEGG